MFTLRCTQKLLKRMHLTTADLKDDVPIAPTTALGDWYAHLLILQRQHIVLLVSEPSRLCVLIPARDIDRLTQRFHYTLIDLLRTLDVSEAAIARERQQMDQICLGLTTGTANGRSVLGSINDCTKPLRYADIQARTLSEWNLYFSKWLSGPLGYQHPGDVARTLLEAALNQET